MVVPYVLMLFNITPYTITSGSMLPTYKVGSIILVSKVDTNDIAVGDVVTFKYGRDTVSHRVVKVEDGGITTKGDANKDTYEGVISYSDIYGKASNFSIPCLGYIYSFIEYNKLIIIGFIILLTVIDFIIEKRGSNKNEE
jgi:signal peptidase